MRSAAYDALVDTYLMRDIRDLAQVAEELRFRRFMTAVASLTARPVVYAQLARLADIDQKTAKAWLSLLVSLYLVKIVQPYSNNALKRLVKQPVMHFIDTGLAAHLAGWSGARALEVGATVGTPSAHCREPHDIASHLPISVACGYDTRLLPADIRFLIAMNLGYW